MPPEFWALYWEMKKNHKLCKNSCSKGSSESLANNHHISCLFTSFSTDGFARSLRSTRYFYPGWVSESKKFQHKNFLTSKWKLERRDKDLKWMGYSLVCINFWEDWIPIGLPVKRSPSSLTFCHCSRFLLTSNTQQTLTWPMAVSYCMRRIPTPRGC